MTPSLFEVYTYVRVSGQPSCEEDDGVPGMYEIKVQSPYEIDLQDIETRLALKEYTSMCFHEEVGISVLDDFEIEYFDEEGEILDRISGIEGVFVDFEKIAENFDFNPIYQSDVSQEEIFEGIASEVPLEIEIPGEGRYELSITYCSLEDIFEGFLEPLLFHDIIDLSTHRYVTDSATIEKLRKEIYLQVVVPILDYEASLEEFGLVFCSQED